MKVKYIETDTGERFQIARHDMPKAGQTFLCEADGGVIAASDRDWVGDSFSCRHILEPIAQEPEPKPEPADYDLVRIGKPRKGELFFDGNQLVTATGDFRTYVRFIVRPRTEKKPPHPTPWSWTGGLPYVYDAKGLRIAIAEDEDEACSIVAAANALVC